MQDLDVLEWEVKELQKDIAELKADIKDLTDAWAAMKGTVNFLKWFLGLVISITSGYVFLKEHLFK